MAPAMRAAPGTEGGTMSRGNFGTCQAGTGGLRCAHPAYCYHSAVGMYLCCEHWSFFSDVHYDISTLPSVALHDAEKEGWLP